MKPVFLEDKLINFLTGVVWWFEVRWNKGAVFVFLLLSLFVPIGFSFLVGLYEVLQTEDSSIIKVFLNLIFLPLIVGFSAACAPFFLIVFVKMRYGLSVLKNTKISPNPNKVSVWIWVCRLIILSFWGSQILMSLDGKTQNITVWAQVTITLMLFISTTVSLYVLCADPIPPLEKEKRRQKNEQEKNNFLPVPAT